MTTVPSGLTRIMFSAMVGSLRKFRLLRTLAVFPTTSRLAAGLWQSVVVGAAVGVSVIAGVVSSGVAVGAIVGRLVAVGLGMAVGTAVGRADGCVVGANVGRGVAVAGGEVRLCYN